MRRAALHIFAIIAILLVAAAAWQGDKSIGSGLLILFILGVIYLKDGYHMINDFANWLRLP